MQLDYNKFYTYSELEAALKELAIKYPNEMRLTSLAETEEKRNIYLVEITDNICSCETPNKAGYYVQASVHSSEPAGGTACLHLINTLLCEKPDILKDVVFYIIPRVNPDGLEENLLFNAGHRSKSIKNPKYKENLIEAHDINNDGLILQMRVKNPLGDFKEIAPGVMVKRQWGETEGEFYDVYEEGNLVNPNGTYPKNSLRCYDFNRSFPSLWKPLENSTEYPLRSIETRTVAEFLVTHPNIFAGVDFHNGSNGILRPHMCDDSKLLREDLEFILSVGEMASEITEFPLIHEYRYGEYPLVLNGNSNNFFYDVLGISHYVIELGNGLNDIGYKTSEILNGLDYRKAYIELKEYSQKEGYEVFRPFVPFNHPQLGEVEIGGLISGRGYYQNPKTIGKISPKTTEFIIKHASMGPVLELGSLECLKLGEDIYRIRTCVKNTGYMGTKVMKGTDSYQAKYPVHVYLEHSNGVEILSRPNVYEIDKLDSMESVYAEWFVKCNDKSVLTLVADHPKAKTQYIRLSLN